MPGRILFIDDDPAGREVALFNLRKAGYEVTAAEDGSVGLSAFASSPYDLVITDLKMPGIPGMEVLRKIRAGSPDVPVLVITAFGNVETAVAAMKEGAYDFIGKPFHRDQLLLAVGKALDRRRLATEVRDLRIRASGVGRDIVSVSPAMRRLLEVTDRVAATLATVLITGESGTGKEVLARRIHVRSPRAEGPFVAVNCAAIPSELLESELFGHARGAFTGAVRDRAGRFRQASGGTLFLDEVAEIPPSLQELAGREWPGGAVEPWDSAYLQERVKQERHDVDARRVRRYFEYGRVKQGVLRLVGRLFGVEFHAVAWVDIFKRKYNHSGGTGRRDRENNYLSNRSTGQVCNANIWPLTAGEQFPFEGRHALLGILSR